MPVSRSNGSSCHEGVVKAPHKVAVMPHLEPLAASTSMDPKDYQWGTITPQHHALFQGFMSMTFAYSAFFGAPHAHAGAPLFPVAPWLSGIDAAKLKAKQQEQDSALPSIAEEARPAPAPAPPAATQQPKVGSKRSAPPPKSKQSASRNVKVRTSHKKKVVQAPAPSEDDVQEVVHGLDLEDIEDLLETGELAQGSDESGITLQGRVSLDESVHASMFDDSFDALVGFGTLLEPEQGSKAPAPTVPKHPPAQAVCDFDTMVADSLGDLMGMSGNSHDSWDSAIALEEYLGL